MPQVEIDNRIITVPIGTTVSAVVAGLDLPCSGKGICGKCRVQVFGAVSDPTPREERYLTMMELADNVRLACQTTIQGDCRIRRLGDTTLVVVEAPQQVIQPHGIGFSRYGVAVDVGTTTLAAHLYDPDGTLLAQIGAPNPQSPYGADVISRVEVAMGGNAGPTDAIRHGLRKLLADLTAMAELTPAEVDGIVITGNTVMLSLLTATDVTPFAAAPFACGRLFGETVSAAEVGLTDCPDASVYLTPCASAFVGGDVATALCAADLQDTALLLDLGTNGEMILQTPTGLYACSTAAGPAFEGVGISCGMTAAQGAIHRVDLVNGALHPTVVGGGEPKGICGSGLIDTAACLLLRGDMTPEGIVDGAASIADTVTLIPDDIRALQVSCSAIRSGIDTLLKAANLTAVDLQEVVVCGGFGHYLSVPNAVRIGLLPAAALSRTRCLGNAALSGAVQLLLDVDRRESLAARIRSAQTVELATDPYFATRFITNMRLEASE